jgi:hypothetical protein
MQLSNEDRPDGGPFAHLIQMQAEFQSRLANESLRYLRRIQGVFEPYAPGTVVQPDGDATLTGELHVGGSIALAVDVENRQRVHAVVTASMTPLVADSGATWFPSVEAKPSFAFVPPNQTLPLSVTISAPADLPVGRYRGLLVLRGFGAGGLPVVLDVVSDPPQVPQPGQDVS